MAEKIKLSALAACFIVQDRRSPCWKITMGIGELQELNQMPLNTENDLRIQSIALLPTGSIVPRRSKS